MCLQRGSAPSKRWRHDRAVGPVHLPIAGGGYFRILPTRGRGGGIRRLNEVERLLPAIFYLHPWEIDPDQLRLSAAPQLVPPLPQPPRPRRRLRSLVREFRFPTMISLPQAQICAPALEAPNAPLPYVW
jgi:hypothetical protein